MQKVFFDTMTPYAIKAGTRLSMPYQVVLAQWALESAYGTSDLAKKSNNFGGIKYTKNADFQSGSYSGYRSISSFVSDYIRVMQLPYYAAVRNAGGVRDTIEAFSQTPYAEDKSYTSKLLSMVDLMPAGNAAGKATGAIQIITGVLLSPIFLLGVGIYLMVKK
jgi:flagellum-specific peptidoglycan hydrolase FlgJ